MCFSLPNKNSCSSFDFKFSLKKICPLFDVLNTFILKSESSECQKEDLKKNNIFILLLLLNQNTVLHDELV